MPVRIKITLLFTSLAAVILIFVVGAVYYFSYTLRIQIIQTRLTNRAITIGRLLSQTDVFSNQLVQRIDSSTSLGYINETIQAYDYKNKKVYQGNDREDETATVDPELLRNTRIAGSTSFQIAAKDAVAYHYVDNDTRLVMIAAGEDINGKQNLKQLIHILIACYLGGLCIAGLSGYVFSKQLLKPIKDIADTVNLISAQNLSQRIKASHPKDEWHYLADTVNLLLDRLQDSFDVQRRFISNASHELSTPLTSISNQIEVSLQRQREAAAYRKVMTSVHQDVLHMSHLVRALLEFAKASGKPGGIEIAAIRVDEILFRIPAEMTKVNRNYSVKLEFDNLPEEEDKLLVMGNDELLFAAIKNLVSNACKYSADNQARVKLSTQKEAVVISVIDKGSGIPSSELERIFQPFHRVEENQAKDGFGLGLSLASRIVKLHKGTIKISSEVHQGSTFTVRLPNTAQ